MRRALFVLAIGTLLSGVVVFGHHSFAASYFEDQLVSVDGIVEVFEYRNPHSWVRVVTSDAVGQEQRVGAEWGNPGRLRQQGITSATIKPGDRVVLTGSPSRSAASRDMHLKRIERPSDGWTWVGRGERR